MPPPSEPRAAQRPLVHNLHGIRLTDEFAWIKDPNWQEVMRDPQQLDPAIRAYLQAENGYCEQALADNAALQEALFAEMKGRIKEDDSTVPDPDGPYAYYVRYRKGGQHPLFCREPRNGGAEQLLLDGDALARGKPFFRLGATVHSPDHRLLAWTSDEPGSEFYTARVRVIDSGADLADSVPDVSGSVVWTADAAGLFYVRLDRSHRPAGAFRHRLGTPASADVRVFVETDPGLFMSVGRLHRAVSATFQCTITRLRKFGSSTSPRPPPNRRSLPRAKPVFNTKQSTIPLSTARRLGDPHECGRRRRLQDRLDAASHPRPDHWRDLVPHRSGVYVLSFLVLRDWLIRLEREDGLPHIVVRRLKTGEEHVMAFAEEAYSLGINAGYEFATNVLRFTYSSMTTPSEVWDYDLVTRARTLRKRQEVPSGHVASNYVTRRLFALAADGATIPISLLHRKDHALDGTAPCLLYGYGAYGISIPAAFDTNRLSLVDRGFVFAIAHVRGGTEKGWRWYREGKLAKKLNTFSDFVAATEYPGGAEFVRRASSSPRAGPPAAF